MEALYTQVVLVGLEIWDKGNIIREGPDVNTMRQRFGIYRKNTQLPKIWSDVSILIT